MRRAIAIACVVVAALAAAACGASPEDRWGRAIAAAAEPSVAAFLTDLEAGRHDAARARGTAAFQAAVSPETIRGVATPLRGVLGPLAGRTFTAAADVPEGPEDVLPGAATLRYAGRYAKGSADLAVRVVRGADGEWRIEAFTAESPGFTWALR